MSIWLNNKIVMKFNLKKDKPCHTCGYCPYGQLVEEFPLRNKTDRVLSCDVFGHDCPMFYHAEDITEQTKLEVMRKERTRRKNAKGN